MNVTDIINRALAERTTRFAFELLPPLKGDGMGGVFGAIDPLMEFDPAYINVTFHREGIKQTQRPDGGIEWHVVRRRPGTVGISAAIEKRYGVTTVPHLICGGLSKYDIEDALIDMDFLGLHNVLALRGDKSQNERFFMPHPQGHAHAADLVRQIAAMNRGELEKASRLRYAELPALEKKLADAKSHNNHREDAILQDEVTEEQINQIVARWTGIPIAKLMEGEREKILHLDDILHKRVIGQDEAVTKVTEAIIRSRAGIADPNRPIGSFLFLGPTGVGKTELAKALAESLFDDEHNLVRIDMTEYMEKFSVSRLIGAPPGYVGYDEGGQLTEAVRRKPYSVVLFDEIEKAHPDVFNILLQVLDDGRITDSQGRTVDFKNTIIILTSNLGSSYLLDGINEDGEISEHAKEQVSALLKQSFRPEFLNRLDEIVYYKPLTRADVSKIIDLLVDGLAGRLAERQIGLEITPAAKELIAENGYDPVYGARPLKRYLQSKIETMIARTMIAEDLESGNVIEVGVENEDFVVRVKKH